MTKAQIQRNREFLKDLRKNRKKARGQLRDEDGGRCCLGVACDTAKRLGLDLKVNDWDGVPPDEVGMFFGWPDVNPTLKVPGTTPRPAAMINDANGTDFPKTSHKRIADLFELTFPKLKP